MMRTRSFFDKIHLGTPEDGEPRAYLVLLDSVQILSDHDFIRHGDEIEVDIAVESVSSGHTFYLARSRRIVEMVTGGPTTSSI